MNQRAIGIIILVIGVILIGLVWEMKIQEDQYINTMIKSMGGSCYLSDGTCLHQIRNFVPYYIGGALAAATLALAFYLIFFDRTQRVLAQQHVEVAHALKDARTRERKNAKFDAFLAGFSEEEQKVLQVVKDEDGITQSTLRFRTGTSKASLSLLLKSLEERGFVSRKSSGKTNKVYLKKVF
jgi:DNA-binding MarR family transcriptional regulator